MLLATFVKQLVNAGKIALPIDASHEPIADGLRSVLQHQDSLRRLELSHTPPEFDPQISEWAALLFFRASRALLNREIAAETIAQDFAQVCPSDYAASAAYSADLIFCFLPDLIEHAKRVSHGDPLVTHLTELATQWPLSSVGTDPLPIPTKRIDSLFDSSALAQLYVDRILEKRDHSRTGDERVKSWLAKSLGLHPELTEEDFANFASS